MLKRKCKPDNWGVEVNAAIKQAKYWDDIARIAETLQSLDESIKAIQANMDSRAVQRRAVDNLI